MVFPLYIISAHSKNSWRCFSTAQYRRNATSSIMHARQSFSSIQKCSKGMNRAILGDAIVNDNLFNGLCSCMQVGGKRHFSSQGTDVTASVDKLCKNIANEISHEKNNYEAPPNIRKFLDNRIWNFTEKQNDVNMCLTKDLNDGTVVNVEFQLISPFQADNAGRAFNGENDNPNVNEEEESDLLNDETRPGEITDFTVTVTRKTDQHSGIIFYCCTLSDDDKFRYMIGNIRTFESEAEKSSSFSYNGPEFEDLDDMMQESLDEYLISLGINNELCDFIDNCAVDKEHREYIRWLQHLNKFFA